MFLVATLNMVLERTKRLRELRIHGKDYTGEKLALPACLRVLDLRRIRVGEAALA